MKHNIEKKMKTYLNNAVCMWIEQESSIHLKAVEKKYNDPAELTVEEAREIANGLIQLAEELENKEKV